MPKLNQKGAIHFIALFILLAGLAAGVFLVTREESFKLFPKAASAPIPGPTLPPSAPIPGPKPDLIISGIEVLGISRVGQTNSINVRVENIGGASAKFPTKVNQGNVSILITTPGDRTSIKCSGKLKSEIKPGEKTSLQIRNCSKYTRTGTHKLTGQVDPVGMIKESNEDNNFKVIQINVVK